MRRCIAFVTLVVLNAGCEGTLGATYYDNIVENQICLNEGPSLDPQVRRLTPKQYENTLKAAFGDIFVASDFPNFQDDDPTIGLANDPDKLRVTTISIDFVFLATKDLSTKIRTQHAPSAACIAGTGTQCFVDLINSVGLTLWRRPVTSTERDALVAGLTAVEAVGGSRDEQADFLMQALLMSPNFLYRTELGSIGAGDLTPYEMASLLSYTFTDGPPDAQLLAQAAAGALSNPEIVGTEAQRLADSPAFIDTLVGFFFDFLKLHRILSVEKAVELGLTPSIRRGLYDSLYRSLHDTLSAPGATLTDPFLGQNYYLNAETAPYFNEDPTGLSSVLVERALSPSQREGILSHPAFTTIHAGIGSTSIVKRGVFTLEQLLRYEIPAPPANVDGVDPANIPSFDPDLTSARDMLTMTHSAQPECVACHQVIDPAGFGFENYDPAGRYRETEKMNVPIDASGTLALPDETLVYSTSPEYAYALAQSEGLRMSIASHFFDYALGSTTNHCEADKFARRLNNVSASIDAIAATLVGMPSFAARKEAQ